MLSKAKEQLDHMGEISEHESHILLTADNYPIDKSVYAEVWEKACDMIFSFEYAFRACWNKDEREPIDKIFDGLHIINGVDHGDEKMPFYMCYMEEAQKELETMKSWDVQSYALKGRGTYFTGGAMMPDAELYYCIPDESSIKEACDYIDMMKNNEIIQVK